MSEKRTQRPLAREEGAYLRRSGGRPREGGDPYAVSSRLAAESGSPLSRGRPEYRDLPDGPSPPRGEGSGGRP
jgi:hypothetical protein